VEREAPATSARRLELGFLVAASALAYPFGLWVGSPWLLPALNTLPAYLVMTRRLAAGERAAAVRAMLLWAVVLAVAGTLSFSLWPDDPGVTVLNGPGYREEMFAWIATGEGAEGSPRLFLPQHLAHLAAFVVLSLATASALSILMGAVLMNYMGYYVASLFRAGIDGWSVLLFGWQPWAICRVAAFCVLGVVLAEPLLARLGRTPSPSWRGLRPWLTLAGAGILADWLLKATLAPTWGLELRALLNAAAGAPAP
jgi:hypothetical protein